MRRFPVREMTMSPDRLSHPGPVPLPLTCAVHEELKAQVIEIRRASELRDRDEGKVMAELAEQSKAISGLDKRIDDLTLEHAKLAVTMASSATIARTGGLLAGGGGGLFGAIEIGRMIGHTLGWW